MPHTMLQTTEDIISDILNWVCPQCGGPMGERTKEFKCQGECRTDWRDVWERSLRATTPNISGLRIRTAVRFEMTPDREETYGLGERRQILNTTILRLRPRVRRVVELHHLQEHSFMGTAQILGTSTSAVKARMFHAKVQSIECHFCRVPAGPFGLTPGNKEEFL